ncbi:MAG: hypothetical protein M3O85_05740 [Acidobacteriota bacterium]|nr:hypothetical protein [Acidobacteriota bacterium]
MLSRATLIAMILLCAATALAQQEASPSKPAEPRLFEFPVAVAQARRVIAFEFPVAGSKYHVARNGLGNRTDGDSPAKTFNLHLSKGDFIRALYFAEYQGDAVLLIEVSNGAYGAGFIVRVGGAIPDIKWKQAIPGINVGKGLVEGDYAYVTAMRFVAKVNLRSGIYAWRHDDLERGDAFDAPALDGNTVLFPARRPSAMTVKADKQTGRILSP